MPFHFLWEKYLKVIDLTFIAMAPFLSCIISHSYLPFLWFDQSNKYSVSQTYFCVSVQRNPWLLARLNLCRSSLKFIWKTKQNKRSISPLKSFKILPAHLFIQNWTLYTSCYVNLSVCDPGILYHVPYGTSCGSFVDNKL